MATNNCPICLHKQRRIDELEEENRRLREKLGVQRRREEGFFGSSTPSSRKPVKPNIEHKEKKLRGANRGHRETVGGATTRTALTAWWMWLLRARLVLTAEAFWKKGMGGAQRDRRPATEV